MGGCGGYVVGWLRRLCGGWVAGEVENIAISALNKVVVEVEAELGKICHLNEKRKKWQPAK